MRLAGKVAIITGGASGIGLATVRLFLLEGARVAMVDYNEEAGLQAVEQLKSEQFGEQDQVMFVKVNVAEASSVESMVNTVVERFGTLDILVNNAGITKDSMLSKMTLEQWHAVIDVNLNGVFYCTKYAAPHMVQKGKGKIINTSSIVGVSGNIGQTNYSAAKAGIIGMTKTWAKELGFKGVNVNAVAPGFIATGMTAAMPENVLEQMQAKVPLRRLGSPLDIAQAYLFLASEESNYVNGTVLEVDGGLAI
ncbi:3-oxoacyl-ACP reductase FabG [Paenibacillus albiflavus]|uniref:3-oxoacyl-ACP reductase FabG n=1 Tax=Paenibacillus albiflavus TaxID=2545760 RepID=A0A4R4EFW7_9BACL|nr:3-oxoacyl-ACP reductase FabG [Paenibacillus albiflavus]TCZ77131.1 3-oxoacyl-ACP reductase FabG [Paenibacillus albiflavus]